MSEIKKQIPYIEKRFPYDVRKERDFQREKRFEDRQHTDEEWLSILLEKIGEVAKGINQSLYHSEIYWELVQVAAITTAWATQLISTHQNNGGLNNDDKNS